VTKGPIEVLSNLSLRSCTVCKNDTRTACGECRDELTGTGAIIALTRSAVLKASVTSSEDNGGATRAELREELAYFYCILCREVVLEAQRGSNDGLGDVLLVEHVVEPREKVVLIGDAIVNMWGRPREAFSVLDHSCRIPYTCVSGVGTDLHESVCCTGRAGAKLVHEDGQISLVRAFTAIAHKREHVPVRLGRYVVSHVVQLSQG
jgi:hypothetical protein